jgi:hypothetical protein
MIGGIQRACKCMRMGREMPTDQAEWFDHDWQEGRDAIGEKMTMKMNRSRGKKKCGLRVLERMKQQRRERREEEQKIPKRQMESEKSPCLQQEKKEKKEKAMSRSTQND